MLKEAIETYAIPLDEPANLSKLIAEIGDATYVLLGEATHGTKEFYTMRAELTKRLIVEKGFTVICVEGEFPPSKRVNQYINGFDHTHKKPAEVLTAFNRWPTWMWANEEVADLIRWLKRYNEQQDKEKHVSFHGIDVYSLWESIEEVTHFLQQNDKTKADYELAKEIYDDFKQFQHAPEHYTHVSDERNSEETIAHLLNSLRENISNYPNECDEQLALLLNALVIKNAESYYRETNHSQSWNIRDAHMVEAIHEIKNYYNEETKVIVWEHNTHIGDARATDMVNSGTINVGQLLREQQKEENVYAIGFGTHRGTVIAGAEWGAPYETMTVPPAQPNSWEHALYEAGPWDKFICFNEQNRHLFNETIDHRAIGVVYNPAYEAYGNYVPSEISDRYDAFIYIDKTNALTPIDVNE